MDIRAYNKKAWDSEVDNGNPWTVPVSHEVIEAARRGNWSVLLTEQKSVPREWFPQMQELDLLALACGGGQQAPVFAAVGANVTVLDNSPRQLDRDREVPPRRQVPGLKAALLVGPGHRHVARQVAPLRGIFGEHDHRVIRHGLSEVVGDPSGDAAAETGEVVIAVAGLIV